MSVCHSCRQHLGIERLRSELADADRVNELVKAECERLRADLKRYHELCAAYGDLDFVNVLLNELPQLRAENEKLSNALTKTLEAVADNSGAADVLFKIANMRAHVGAAKQMKALAKEYFSIQRGLAQSAKGEVKSLGSFAKHGEDEE